MARTRRPPRLHEPLPAAGPTDDILRSIAATDRVPLARSPHHWIGLVVLAAIVALVVEVCLYSAERNAPIPEEHILPRTQ